MGRKVGENLAQLSGLGTKKKSNCRRGIFPSFPFHKTYQLRCQAPWCALDKKIVSESREWEMVCNGAVI